jgi:prevent-host-death family protein
MAGIVGIAEAKNDLSELVNRAAYGGERIVLGSRGKPKAAIVSLADLQRLQEIENTRTEDEMPPESDQVEMFDTRPTWTAEAQMGVLDRSANLRAAMRQRRGGRPLPDSVPLLRQIRSERSL